MGLRIEHDLGVDHAIGGRPSEVCSRKVVEVLACLQDLGTSVINIQKILQIREVVSRSHVLHRSIGNSDAIAFGEREHELRLKAAFDMQVKLGLGQSDDEAGEVIHERCSPIGSSLFHLQSPIT